MPLRICSTCHTPKPPKAFYKDPRLKSGLWAKCRVCAEKAKKEWMALHPEQTKAIAKRHYEKHREDIKAAYAVYRVTHVQNLMFRAAKQRSRMDKLPFNLELSDIVIPEICPILAIPLMISSTGRAMDNSPSLDKIIPELGYVKGNIQVISKKANTMKSNASEHELIAFAGWVAETYGL